MIIKIFQFRHVCIVFLFKAIYESPVIFWTFGLKLAYFLCVCLLCLVMNLCIVFCMLYYILSCLLYYGCSCDYYTFFWLGDTFSRFTARAKPWFSGVRVD